MNKKLIIGIACMVSGLFFLLVSEVREKQKITFEKDIDPLLKSNCRPCHYTGGKVFQKLPFENYRLVSKLGKKLNTRLKEQSQQALITSWIESGMREK